MAIDVRIMQTRKNKEPMPLRVILGNDLFYGAYDDHWRLKPGEMDEDEFLAYIPLQIGRGITVEWSEKELFSIRLRILTPSTPSELRVFYETVERVADYWEADEIEVDGRFTGLYNFLDGYKKTLAVNQKSLKDMARSVISGRNSELTFFCAIWPLVMGKAEAEAFIAEPSYFAKWLHSKQNMKAYYGTPAFYKAENLILGRYALPDGALSILPTRAYVPYGYNDPETDELLKCDDFGILMYDSKECEILGEIPYDEFVANIKKKFPKRIKPFDGNHFVLEKLDVEEMRQLLEEEAKCCDKDKP